MPKPLTLVLPVLFAPLAIYPLGAFGDSSAKNENQWYCEHGNPPQSNQSRCLGGGSRGIARADFNNDGFADLAIGVPGEDTPANTLSSGAVIVIYGSANGLIGAATGVPTSQFWSQNSSGIPGDSEAADRFGSALAGGDFNGDGFSDLAIAAPGDAVVVNGVGSRGRVVVIYGSSTGLNASAGTGRPAAQSWALGDLNDEQQLFVTFLVAETEADVPASPSFNFGSSLAWGDFDGDGVGDLAVGMPEESLRVSGPVAPQALKAGAVGIFFGTRTNGLASSRSKVWTQNSPGVLGDAAADDRFGQTLAGGDFAADGASDLAIGIPLKDVAGTSTQGGGTIRDAGAVLVLFGSPNIGLTANGDQVFDETDIFINAAPGNVSLPNDQFGFALAAGKFDGDARDDLAVGAPLRDVNRLADAGAVFVKYSNTIPLGGRVQFWQQTALFGSSVSNQTGSPTEPGDQLGFALASGDFNADGRQDLAIGAPGEDVFVARGGGVFESVSDAGEVNVIYGSTDGLSTARAPQQWHQETINIDDLIEIGDRFGSSLTAWNFGRDETKQLCTTVPPQCFNVPVLLADLAIGVPFENVGTVADAGAMNVIYGSLSTNGLGFTGDQFWTQDSPNIPGGPEASDFFGSAAY